MTWIPVTERLPTTAQSFIVTLEGGELAMGKCFYAKYNGERYWSVIGMDDFLIDEREVLAWMERPKVYKPEGETK